MDDTVRDTGILRKRKFGFSQREWNLRPSGKKRNRSSPNRSPTYDLKITSSDALPLSYRRLVGPKAIKQGSYREQTSCILPGFEVTFRKNYRSGKTIRSAPVGR